MVLVKKALGIPKTSRFYQDLRVSFAIEPLSVLALTEESLQAAISVRFTFITSSEQNSGLIGSLHHPVYHALTLDLQDITSHSQLEDLLNF
jgi:hypothetical protein